MAAVGVMLSLERCTYRLSVRRQGCHQVKIHADIILFLYQSASSGRDLMPR